MRKNPAIPAATARPDGCKLRPAQRRNRMPALSLDHWNVYCKDLKATVRFYETLCRPQGRRPSAVQLPRRVALCRREADPAPRLGDRPQGSRQRRHRPCRDQLLGHPRHHRPDQEGRHAVRGPKVPARPLQQVFVHDPDGIMIELNFWHEADVPEIDKAPSPATRSPRRRTPKVQEAAGRREAARRTRGL